jgi:small-conductance mechanosensitive channel
MFRTTHLLVLSFVLASGILSSGQTESPALPDSARVITYLNQSISWYQHSSVEEQLATEPRDLLFVNQNRQLADQIIRLSFDFANAEAQRLAPAALDQSQGQTDSSAQRSQSMLAMVAKADQQAKQAQAEVESLKDKLESAKGKHRESLRAAIAEVQSEAEMAEARRDVLRTMIEFRSSATGKGDATTLRSQVEQLERTVPIVSAAKSVTRDQGGETRPAAPTTSSAANKKEQSGILGLITELIALSRKSSSLDETIQMTSSLAESGKSLRTPLGAALKQAVQQGDQISNQPDSTDPEVLKQQKAQLDALIAQYKGYSAVVLPLSKQRLLLDLYQRSLTNWKDVVRAEYKADLRNLAVRLGALATVLVVVLAFSELWRRAIFRYVHDAKRRYQFLLLRRIVLWFLIAMIVAFAFSSELGSLATFAGLLTAGVAVALQNVILSVVGYFLLIGKYGIRVGDRVQIAGVTGEVVEIGLVRLHLMEWGGVGSDSQPTGRVVAFSNSVVFQPTGCVFKQIPGTNYVWHEITLTLAPESDFRAVEERLVSAVESVYSEYRESIEKQRKHLEKTIGPMAAGSLNPQSRLRLTKAGLEVVIRYPLELERASELDDRITREVLDVIEQPPKLKLVGAGAPNIQQVMPVP